MTPERRQQIDTLFRAALRLPSGERQAYLDRHGPDDLDISREVLSLLEAHDQAVDFLEEPAGEYVDSLKSPARTFSEGPSIGKKFEGYRILRYLGRGGMGIVFEADHPMLNHSVVLKFLSPNLITDEIAIQRFIHEAGAASALDHQNICTIHDIKKTDSGQWFIVMPYYQGQTLKDKIAQGPLPLEETLDIATQIVRGLAMVHTEGIVHRDIKPANVMVTEAGVVKILDFGIAKMADVTLTKTGTTLGTPAYMSPEQMRDEKVDHQTDIWSMGVLLYEMLTGVHPFKGRVEAVIAEAVLNKKPEPLTRLRGDLPPECERIVNTCLEKNRARRFQDAKALLAALEVLRRRLADDTKPHPASTLERVKTFVRRRPVWFGVTVVLMLAIASYFIFPPFADQVVPVSDSPNKALGQNLDSGVVSSTSPTGVDTTSILQGSLANGATDDSLVVLPTGTEESQDDPPPEVVPGSLNITSNPEGASIIIDGRESGTTPLLISDVALGRRAIELRLAGYEPYTERVLVSPEQTRNVNATMQQLRGKLLITVNPSGRVLIVG